MTGKSMHDGMALMSPGSGCPLVIAACRVPPNRCDDETIRYASGCGPTAEEAREKCALELIERISGQFSGAEQVLRCAAADLDTNSVLPPELMLFSNSQYATHESRRRAASHVEDFPTPWSGSASIDWIRASPALSAGKAWLPAGLALVGHAKDRAAGLVPADTNGLAAGYSTEDAAVRGFMELVERDAVAIWWYNRLVRPRIDTDVLGDPLVARYAEWSRSTGRSFRLIDLTHDFNIPVIAALTHDRDDSHIALGFGAGARAGEAARHAVAELAQFECNAALIERRARTRGAAGATVEAIDLLRWWCDVRLGDCPHLDPAAIGLPPPAIEALDLAQCHAKCAGLGLSFLAVDLTRPGDRIPVVRVFVPGLRPIWPRFAPGRLYEVPVERGWLRRPLDQSELNPRPIMF
jgi:ribosomal protein S12 methylthiotransferase accessory factor